MQGVVDMPRHVKHLAWSFGLVSFLGLLMDAPASLVTSLLGVRIIPTFDAPWLSSSLADFWGRRWNITTSAVLRTLVYDPIVEGARVRVVGERVLTWVYILAPCGIA
jgi:D-alanyl-lipoteichoic acid acyltransferase DltB (MBOAT superfamily)